MCRCRGDYVSHSVRVSAVYTSLYQCVEAREPAAAPSLSRTLPISEKNWTTGDSFFPDRPSKILLVQVGTLSSSHPSFGFGFLFLSRSLSTHCDFV